MNVGVRRAAAVIIAIDVQPPHGIIFVQRASHLRAHAGQIGLPGGAADDADGGDLRRTALRELHEEVGIEEDRVEILGHLPVIRSNVSAFDVTAFIGTARFERLRADGIETAEAFTVPLDAVIAQLDDGIVLVGSIEVESPMLNYDGRRIWGLTGRILRMFVDAWATTPSEVRMRIESRLAPP